MKEAFGGLNTDWKEGINWAAVRQWRLARAREAMARHGLGALLLFYDENMRYVSATYPEEIRPGMVFALETQHGKVHDFGVRLEEMLLVTEDGHELLSSYKSDEIIVVE